MRVALWASVVVLLGLALRVAYFDLMEFKYDEVAAITLTQNWRGHGLPQFGMMSGVGVRNPPGFIFMLMPIVALTASPLLIGLWVTAWNVAALALTYRLGRQTHSPAAGLWACAFMATHPWLILYSRKIWAQSMLPFFVLLFLLLVIHCMQRPRSRIVFWMPPLVALAWQIHYSAWCLAIFACVWLPVQALRKRVNLGMLLGGCLAALAVLLPYLRYLAATRFADLASSFQVGNSVSLLANILSVLTTWARTAFAGGFGFPFAFGLQPLSRVFPGAFGAALDLCALAGTGLVLLLAAVSLWPWRVPDTPHRQMPAVFLWLAAFAVLPALLYAARGIPVHPHYFIAGMPALLLLAGIGAARMQERWNGKSGSGRPARLLAALPGVIAVLCGAGVWLSVIARVNDAGGTAGDYGLAYRVQADAARVLAVQGVAPENVDGTATRDGSIGVLYLLNHTLPDRALHSDRKAVLIDSLLYPQQTCPATGTGARRVEAGPLKICGDGW